MITEIDEKRLIELIKAFFNLTGIKVAVYDSDFNEIAAYPKNNSPLCTVIQQNTASCGKCGESTGKLCVKCSVKQKVIIEKCHAGLTEVIAPLTDGVDVLGYIMFGQVRTEEDVLEFCANAVDKCADCGIDNSVIEELASNIKYYSYGQLEDASKILSALAGYIVFNRIVYPGVETEERKIAEYILNNLDKDLSVPALCRVFYMSKSELYKHTARLMPDGVANYIKNKRLEKSAALLTNTGMSVWEICEKTGFGDMNYFMRLFRNKFGVSVSEYRAKK